MSTESLRERALRAIAGGVNSPVRSLHHVGGNPLYFEKAQGPFLFDVDGKKYTDFCMAFGPHLLGHSPDCVIEALQEQIPRGTTFGACHPSEVKLAELILKAFPFCDQARLMNSGTEAVMTAVRLARGATGRTKVVQFEGCYHGHSDGLLAKAGSGVAFLAEACSSGVPSAIVSETLVSGWGDLEALDALFSAHPNQIAAVILEPVPANNGLCVPTRDTLSEVLRLAHSAGALVIFDEVISGFRLGLSGASGYFDLQPDLVTLGKVIGGGLPMGAVVGRRSLMENLAPVGSVYQAGTLSGNPLSTEAGRAVLEKIYRELPYEILEKRTRSFVDRLTTGISHRATVHSLASLFWICFEQNSSSFPIALSHTARESYAELFRKALSRGIYLPPSPFEVGFISLAHSPELLAEAAEKLIQCVD